MWRKREHLSLFLCFCVLTIMFLFVFNFGPTSLLGEASEVLAKEEMSPMNEEKIVYLTFDDGPTVVTKRVLEVLEEENVTGTFFVIGQLVEQNKQIAEKIKSENHAICVHTYTHEDKIYRSIETFMDDHSKCSKAVEEVIGKEAPKFMRFPGGSSSTMARKPILKEIRGQLVDKGMYYVDWNITIDDSFTKNKPANTLVNKFNKEFNKEFKNNDKDRLVVLMHDAYYNKTTVTALKEIIQTLKKEGYTFKNFNDIDEKELKILEEKSLINKHEKRLDKQVNK